MLKNQTVVIVFIYMFFYKNDISGFVFVTFLSREKHGF